MGVGAAQIVPPEESEADRLARLEREFAQLADNERARLTAERTELLRVSIAAEDAATRAKLHADEKAWLLK
eukprot:6727752-Heterocapsa_arctica.AAC.1